MIEPAIESWTAEYVGKFDWPARDPLTEKMSRVLLRPHGRSAENVQRSSASSLWALFDDKTLRFAYDTRAQAAQAACSNDDLSKLPTQQKSTEEAMEGA